MNSNGVVARGMWLVLFTVAIVSLVASGCNKAPAGSGGAGARSQDGAPAVSASDSGASTKPGKGQRANGSQVPAKGLDLTFFVASDTHFGVEGIETRNKAMIDQMNSLPGAPYPRGIGGKVGVPMGVLVSGDCTDGGGAEQWRQFVQYYGLTGKDGLLKYPVYETVGNHDGGDVVSNAVARRHGDTYYAWDWQGVHMVCLGMYPNGEKLQWLREDLRKVGTQRPVVVYFHYALAGYFSGPEWWSDSNKQALARSIRGYNVIGIIHGHYHSSTHYKWSGYDVYLVGSPKHATHRFLVFHITGDRMTVAARNFDNQQWSWQHSKAIVTPQGAGATGAGSSSRGVLQPAGR